ncbi:MAG: hypothetical protein PUP92_26735 [Rhizonema sp. PD38]|nr:hypothetical protein [Rhizonema sp. PD38]
MLQAGERQRSSPTTGNPPILLARQRTGSSSQSYFGRLLSPSLGVRFLNLV